MPTLVCDPQPVEFELLLERCRALGQDLLDEVLAAVYHTNRAPHRRRARPVQQLSNILGLPARRAGLDPLIVDPEKRTVRWLGLTYGQYEPLKRRALVELGPDELARRIDWP